MVSTPLSPTRQRFGLIPIRKGRGIVLVPGSAEALTAVSDHVLERYPRANLFACGPRAAAIEHALQLPELPAGGSAFARMLTRAKAHLVLLGAGDDTPRAWVEAARHVQVPCALVGDPQGDEPWLDLLDYAFVRSEAGQRALADHPRIRASTPHATDADLTAALLATVEEELVRHRRQGKAQRPLERFGRWLVLDSPLAPLFEGRFEEIGDLDALADALGRPRTILALGNGPSSEDPAVREASHDALFRVNHAWMDRGIHRRADVVFTGLRSAVMRHPLDAVFVFQTEGDALDMRFKCANRRGRIHFATADRLGAVDQAEFGVYRPTNGAVMVATAVALQPERLLLGGIDLFSHPSGTYPGDTSTPNAYTLAHDRNTELEFILRCLDRYQGELVILSDILRVEWEQHRARRASEDRMAASRAQDIGTEST